MVKAPIILVVNADDFGLSAGINQGIKQAYDLGILRSTSLMPNGRAFDHAVKIAADCPGLGVGIHLSLVGETCVAPKSYLSGLVDMEGRLPKSHLHFMKKYALRCFGAWEIKSEIEAQIHKVLSTGIKPTHIDSHQHLHVLPSILKIVLDVARINGIPIVRLPIETAKFGGRGVQKSALSVMCRRVAPQFKKAGIFHADHFFGFRISGNMNEPNLLRTIGHLRPGVNEVMCHPGLSDAATKERCQWGYRWEDEQLALMSECVRFAVEEKGIRLASFADAWKINMTGQADST